MMNVTTMVTKVGIAKNMARLMSPGKFSFRMMWDAISNDVDPIKAAIITTPASKIIWSTRNDRERRIPCEISRL